ncbi:MAG: hypothetical protein NXY57DRAFT_1081369, partial [Lentinula lateritia]
SFTDTCRICSAPAEPDQPLFHPCKCSGTIRYIHQDCLTTWLAHSKKKTCDTCRHQFLFKKVYAPDMPSTLPPLLMMRRLIQQGFYALLMVVRAIVVSLVWLSLIPLLTVWSWRAYFRMGESIAWWISNRQPLPGQEDLRPTNKFLVREIIELTNSFLDDPTPPPSDISTLINRIVSHPRWLSISADIFTGQIIAALIVITFVAIFLLREWIAQNARPGQFDDEDGQDILQVPPAPEPNPQPAPRRPVARRPAVPRMDVNARLALAHRQIEAVRALDALRAQRQRILTEEEKRAREIRAQRNGRSAVEFAPTRSDELEHELDKVATKRARKRRMEKGKGKEEEDDAIEGKALARIILLERMERRKFNQRLQLARQNGIPNFASTAYVGPPTLIPTVISSSNTSISRPGTPIRRPPLPTTLPSSPGSGTSSPSVKTPLASPNLATYRAPEELINLENEDYFAGPSTSESDTEPELVIDLPEPEARNVEQREEPHVVDPQAGNENAGAEVDEDEEDDEEEDEEEDEDGEDEIVEEFQVRPQPREGAAVAFNAARPQPQQGPLVLNADDALLDELEAGVDDDMDGAMEAIGLRGPIYGLAQNAALMILIMDSVIGFAMWIPYTLGKSTAFLMLEPQRMLFILHLPIRAIRLVTDPAVDLVAYIIIDVLLPPHIQLLQTSGAWLVQLFFWIISESLGVVKAKKMRESYLYSFLESCFESVIHALKLAEGSTEEIVHSTPKTGIIPSFLAQTFPNFMDYVEPYFATLGKEIRQGHEQFRGVFTQLAIGNGPAERIFSVIFGYCIIASALAVYMNILTIGNVKTAGRAVRTAVKQQLLVLKVASFIFIELVTFPLGCGVVLDICTLWFFPGASYVSRMEFSYQAPLTAIFYHWVVGTMFMYSFAVLLSGCRSIMRPGGMWFIKDPQDQNAHPIRDILERAALVQLRKICISGIMYTFVVVCTVFSVAALLFLGQKILLPIRWKTREPLSNIPIDLLFLNIALPYTMTYFRPRRALRKFTMVVWKGLARRLRLTSYFFGLRLAEEEYTPKKFSLSRIIYGPSKDASILVEDYDGSFRRVPNTDDLAIPRDIPATVAVTATGEPVNEEAMILMTQQDMETVQAKHSIRQDFTVVYIPPYFRYRMILFVLILWTFGALCLGISVALPILIGRGFFGMVFKGKREVHDGYSIIAGFYMLWACWVVGRAVDRLDKRRQRWGNEGPRASLWWLAVKRGLLWIVKASYMAVFLGIVIPTLVGGVVELYIVLPFKLRLSPDIVVPRIRVLECWATGILYMKIAMRVTRRQAQNPIARGVQIIKRNGWTHPDPIAATKDVIAPVAGGLTGMIVLPGLVFYVVDYFFPLVGHHVNNQFLFTYVYSSLFCLAGLTHTFIVLREMLASWSQAVRDKEFLVEMRLKNLDTTSEQQSRTSTLILTVDPEPDPAQVEDLEQAPAIVAGDRAAVDL